LICALTARKLRAGTFDQFREAFMAPVQAGRMPAGWRSFNMLRGTDDPDEVICFGIFEGTLDDLRANAALVGYADQQAAIAPYVQSVGADGFFEVIEDVAP